MKITDIISEAAIGTTPKRPSREGSRPERGHEPQKRYVTDRKTGKQYDPDEEFDKLKNNPEFQAQMKRMATKEGVAETVPMSDAVKVLKHYGAEHFKTTSNELHFYKNGRGLSVDLVMNSDATRSVTLSSLNSATRRLKGQGVAEGAPIVVMPRADRLKKAEPTKVRYQGDIVPPTKPPSTEKRGVKGRPGQRPMPQYEQGVAEGWKDKVAGGALALGALGGIGALQNAAPNVTVQGHQMQLANPGTQPDDAKLVTTDDGKKIYAWKTTGQKNRSQWVYRPVEQVKEAGVAEAGNKALEPHIGMGDSRTPRELKNQMKGASDEFVKSNAGKKPGVFHSKVSHMQSKLAKSELRKRDQHMEEMEQEFAEAKAPRSLCVSSKPDEDLGASQLASCKSQGLRARDGEKSHKLGKTKKSRVKVGGKRIKGDKYGGPLPDWS